MNFVAIDFETANENRSSVCCLGIVTVEQGVVVDKVSWLIKPPVMYFNPYNVYIHGITEDDVKDKPEFNELWPVIVKYLKDRLVFAHYASFDFSVLRYVLDEYDLQYPDFEYGCSWEIAKKVWPQLTCYRLDFISAHINCLFNHHIAVEDAGASANIIIEAARNRSATSIKALIDSLDLRLGRLYPGGYKPSSEAISGFSKLQVRSIMAQTDKFDINHPIFGKNFVFTGVMHSMPRKDAAQKVVNVGGHCEDTVTQNTNYLVLGELDYRTLAKGEFKSNKLKKAELYIQKGQDLEIIGEDYNAPMRCDTEIKKQV